MNYKDIVLRNLVFIFMATVMVFVVFDYIIASFFGIVSISDKVRLFIGVIR